MKDISRMFLFGALALMLLTTACAGQQVSPTPVATTPPASTATVEATGTSTITLTPTTTVTAGIPVTGPTTASIVCQFCMDDFAHALVVIPAAATFTLLTPAASASTTSDVSTGCDPVETFRDRQLVLCRAPGNTTLNLNVCQGNDCRQFAIKLQTCPPLPFNTATLTATPTKTPSNTPAPSNTPTLTTPVSSPTSTTPTSTAPGPSSTPVPGSPTITTTVSPTPTPEIQ